MNLLWPELLWLFLTVPALIAAYFALLRKPVKRALPYPAVGLLGAEADATYRFRTHVPAVLLLASLCAFLLAAARPVIGEIGQVEPRRLILMIDVSYSMAATDVMPSRLQVAKQIASAIVKGQPQDVLVGVVAFSSHARLVQAPTASRTKVHEALATLDLQSGSALGTGLLGSLMTLFPESDLARGYDVFGHHVPRFAYPPASGSEDEVVQPAEGKRRRPGVETLARILVLSDGQSTHGVPLDVAISIATERAVRIFAVGIGTGAGGTVEVSGQLFQVGFEETGLAAMTTRTGGRYWRAAESADLARLLQAMEASAVYEPRFREITVLLSALGLCLLLAAAATSLQPLRIFSHGGRRKA